MIDRARTTRRLAVCGICAATLLITGCADNSLQSATTANDPLGNPLVMLGLRADPDREIIEYNPRGPLVIPDGDELPPPERQVADLGADWPDDPDLRAAREYEAARRAAGQESVRDVNEASQPMSRAELDEWGRRFGRVSDREPAQARREDSEAVSPEELAARTGGGEPPATEPARQRLTEPPAGYRQRADTGEEYVEEEERRGFLSRLFGGGRGAQAPVRRENDRRHDPTSDF